eukprot:7897423-Alexandrium_andersonii.AAC.1
MWLLPLDKCARVDQKCVCAFGRRGLACAPYSLKEWQNRRREGDDNDDDGDDIDGAGEDDDD